MDTFGQRKSRGDWGWFGRSTTFVTLLLAKFLVANTRKYGRVREDVGEVWKTHSRTTPDSHKLQSRKLRVHNCWYGHGTPSRSSWPKLSRPLPLYFLAGWVFFFLRWCKTFSPVFKQKKKFFTIIISVARVKCWPGNAAVDVMIVKAAAATKKTLPTKMCVVRPSLDSIVKLLHSSRQCWSMRMRFALDSVV